MEALDREFRQYRTEIAARDRRELGMDIRRSRVFAYWSGVAREAGRAVTAESLDRAGRQARRRCEPNKLARKMRRKGGAFGVTAGGELDGGRGALRVRGKAPLTPTSALYRARRVLERVRYTCLETSQISSQRRLALGVSTEDWEQERRAIGRELERRGSLAPAERWTDCQSRLVMAACEGDQSLPAAELRQATAHHRRYRLTRCELRICPWCARRAAAKEVSRLLDIIASLEASGTFRPTGLANRQTFKMLTLTLKPSGDLRADFKRLSKGWRELQKRAGFEKDKRARLFGGFSALELGPSGNPHLHILYWGRYVPKDRLQELWREITGDSYVVEIHQVRGSLRDAAREVGKYVTKVSVVGGSGTGSSPDNEPALNEYRLVDLLLALRGRRRIATHGVFYGVKLFEPPKLEDLCSVCSAKMNHVGIFAPEHLQPWQLEEYFRGPPDDGGEGG